MLERIRQLRKRRTPLRRFEITTPLSIEECLVRLTGRHPPFGKNDPIARPHPFSGVVDLSSISITLKTPYVLVGSISEQQGHARIRADLCYESGTFLSSMFGLLWFWVLFTEFCVLIPLAVGRRIDLSVVIGMYIGSALFTVVVYRLGQWLDQRRLDAYRSEAPDISDTLQVLANLVLATDMREIPFINADEPATETLGSPT